MLWSDAERIRQGLNCELIGMTEIKRRRLEELDVDCHPGTKVGEYVPFYFCPRSIMLYLLHAGNHPDLSYRGGQRPILHLESDLKKVVKWATTAGQRWAFSTGNAGARYARFLKDLGQIEKLNWEAIAANKWRDPDLKEGKQAEFLIERFFPWECIDTIGVINTEMVRQVTEMTVAANHRPAVLVHRDWYY